MKKYQLFTISALVILSIFFTIPIAGFYGAMGKIKSYHAQEISPYSKVIWDIYSPLQYVSQTTPREAANSLEKMIETSSETGMASVPVWSVSLEAPNYPKDAFPNGIPVFFHFDGFSGEVHEMNTINHYIGMYPMERGAQLEMSLMPYIFLTLSILMIAYLCWNSKSSWILLVLPALLPVGFLGDFAIWLYWFGHNMQEWGAFKIKPFMPTVFGDGKVAQFTTHSYPSLGFYLLLVISFLCILAIFSKLKEQKMVKR
ncbi:MAG: cytochrome C [Campylobacteraceae bacterium]|nr:cytochrome C [Campylobacteraceae bacterium]